MIGGILRLTHKNLAITARVTNGDGGEYTLELVTAYFLSDPSAPLDAEAQTIVNDIFPGNTTGVKADFFIPGDGTAKHGKYDFAEEDVDDPDWSIVEGRITQLKTDLWHLAISVSGLNPETVTDGQERHRLTTQGIKLMDFVNSLETLRVLAECYGNQQRAGEL